MLEPPISCSRKYAERSHLPNLNLRTVASAPSALCNVRISVLEYFCPDFFASARQ
jgi:hypothetical protein